MCLYIHKSTEIENTILEDEIKVLKSNINSLKAKLKAVSMELEFQKINAMKGRIVTDGNKNWKMVAKDLIA